MKRGSLVIKIKLKTAFAMNYADFIGIRLQLPLYVRMVVESAHIAKLMRIGSSEAFSGLIILQKKPDIIYGNTLPSANGFVSVFQHEDHIGGVIAKPFS